MVEFSLARRGGCGSWNVVRPWLEVPEQIPNLRTEDQTQATMVYGLE